jgi:hypothetical protein
MYNENVKLHEFFSNSQLDYERLLLIYHEFLHLPVDDDVSST